MNEEDAYAMDSDEDLLANMGPLPNLGDNLLAAFNKPPEEKEDIKDEWEDYDNDPEDRELINRKVKRISIMEVIGI